MQAFLDAHGRRPAASAVHDSINAGQKRPAHDIRRQLSRPPLQGVGILPIGDLRNERDAQSLSWIPPERPARSKRWNAQECGIAADSQATNPSHADKTPPMGLHNFSRRDTSYSQSGKRSVMAPPKRRIEIAIILRK